MKHSWAPIVLLQAVAVCLVVAYYMNPGLQLRLEGLERFKVRGGIPFDLVAGALAGGVIPQFAKLLTGKAGRVRRGFWLSMLFTGFVYAIVAVEVDIFYQLQGRMFGTQNDLATLLKKDVVDMGLFTPFLSIPTAVLLFEWRNAGFSWTKLGQRLRSSFYRAKVMPALIPCWAFWVPMLMCVYALPPNLQFPFAQLSEASWAVLFIFIATDDDIH